MNLISLHGIGDINMNQDTLYKVLREIMEEKSLSLRKLGEISGINHATLSKIMNGKRKANITHLKKISERLNIELRILMEAAGYLPKNESKDDFLEGIQQMIKLTDTPNKGFNLDKVNHEIAKYKELCKTDEGQKKIKEGFHLKLDELGSTGATIDKLLWMFSRFINNKGKAHELALMGAALLYFIVTTDLIPDHLLAVGFLDDAYIIRAISQHLENKGVM